MTEVVVIAAKRTPIGSFLGSLSKTSSVDLATHLAKHLLEKFPNISIDEVILGNVLQAGQGQNVARQVLLKSGIDKSKSAYVVNLVCGSGLKAVELGFNSIKLGNAEIVMVGGTENMSLCPYVLDNARVGFKMGNQNLTDIMIKDGLWCAINDYHMGITAENLASEYNISRQEQDEFAYHSHKKAIEAIDSGKFNDEILPVILKSKKGEVEFREDEFVRRDINLESLSKLKAAFKDGGSVSAGNSSGINDGAAMLILASRQKAVELGLPILATLKSFATVGVRPEIMGIGAAFAAKKLLEKEGMSIDSPDIIEANEAFAAQSLATIKELKADVAKVNIHGGAVALGHPIGASGARILTTLIYALRQRSKNLGLATLCVGGGQGISALVEIKD